MFSLTGATRYKYIPNYKDMRGGCDKLCGVVRTLTGKMEEGEVFARDIAEREQDEGERKNLSTVSVRTLDLA